MRFMAKCVLEKYTQDNNDTSYISAAYSTANVVLIKVWGHKLQCMFEEYAKDYYACFHVYSCQCFRDTIKYDVLTD